MKKLMWVIAGAFILGLLSGCKTNLSSYEPMGSICKAPVAGTIYVTKAKDKRNRKKYHHNEFYLIPLVPYSDLDMVPESYPYYIYRRSFMTSLGMTVAKDLKASGIARDVKYVDDVAGNPNMNQGDLLINPVLYDAIWVRHVTCYGVSIAGGILHLILPRSFGHVELNFQLNLKDSGGNKVGAKDFYAEESVIEFLYFRPFNFKLKDAYGEISPQMRKFVFDSVKK